MLLDEYLISLAPRGRSAAANSIRKGGVHWGDFVTWARVRVGVSVWHDTASLVVLSDSYGFFYVTMQYESAMLLTPAEIVSVFGRAPDSGFAAALEDAVAAVGKLAGFPLAHVMGIGEAWDMLFGFRDRPHMPADKLVMWGKRYRAQLGGGMMEAVKW